MNKVDLVLTIQDSDLTDKIDSWANDLQMTPSQFIEFVIMLAMRDVACNA